MPLASGQALFDDALMMQSGRVTMMYPGRVIMMLDVVVI